MPEMDIDRMRELDRLVESSVPRSLSQVAQYLGLNVADLHTPPPPQAPLTSPLPYSNPVPTLAPVDPSAGVAESAPVEESSSEDIPTASLYQTVRWALMRAFEEGAAHHPQGPNSAGARQQFESHLREWLGYQVCAVASAETQDVQQRNLYLRSLVVSMFSISPARYDDLGHGATDTIWQCPFCQVLTRSSPNWDDPWGPHLSDIEHSTECLFRTYQADGRESIQQPGLDVATLAEISESRRVISQMASAILGMVPRPVHRFGRIMGLKCPHCSAVWGDVEAPPATLRDMTHDSQCIVHLALENQR